MKRSSSGTDFANIVNVKTLTLSNKGVGPEPKNPPPPVPYLQYPPPYLYPYPVPPPPVMEPKVKQAKILKPDPTIEKDEQTLTSMENDIQNQAEFCIRAAVVEDNWEEKHKILLEDFIRQEEENKFNLLGQEDQVLQSFLTSNKCRMGKTGKRSEKRADPPLPPLRVSVTGHSILTIMFLVFLFFLHSFADLPMGSYVILAILG